MKRYKLNVLLCILGCVALPSLSIAQTVKRKNLLYFDATANFARFCNKDSIIFYLMKSKDAGVTDVIIDVKPISGEVLYPSTIVPEMKEWNGVKRAKSFDMLSVFIKEAHNLDMKVHASLNIFVAGHNLLRRGVVFNDKSKLNWQSMNYTINGTVPITSLRKKYAVMINPALKEVQDYELSILKEIIQMYPKLDGVVLDRVRYDGIEADFSEQSRDLFEKYIGQKLKNFPSDIYSYSDFKSGKRIEGPLFKKWLEWRAKVIHDFMYKARTVAKRANSEISFGDYTGSWYPTYFEVGVNWASKTYDASKDFAWATRSYKNFGYAEALDLYTTGSYYFEVSKSEAKDIDTTKVSRAEAGQGTGKDDWYTVEGSTEMAVKLVNGKAPVYAGLYVEQYRGHPEQFVKALKMCRAKSEGAMIFDIVHIINMGWWNHLRKGLLN